MLRHPPAPGCDAWLRFLWRSFVRRRAVLCGEACLLSKPTSLRARRRGRNTVRSGTDSRASTRRPIASLGKHEAPDSIRRVARGKSSTRRSRQMITNKTSHITIRSWTTEQNDRLVALANSGASAMRAAVALKRSIVATRNQARKLGVSFRSIKSLRAGSVATPSTSSGSRL